MRSSLEDVTNQWSAVQWIAEKIVKIVWTVHNNNQTFCRHELIFSWEVVEKDLRRFCKSVKCSAVDHKKKYKLCKWNTAVIKYCKRKLDLA